MSFEKMWGQPDEKVDLAQEKLKSQEKQKEAVKQETDRLFKSLDNPSVTLEDLHELVDKFAENNPRFAEALKEFQDNNSARVIEMLKANATQKEVKENEEKQSNSFEYFWVIIEDFKSIENELAILDLDINKLLDRYKDYIENNLEWLNEEYKDKLKLAISKKILSLSNEIEELKWKLNLWEDFKNNRWIINEKIQEYFSYINNKILPSLALLSKINTWKNIQLKEEWLYDMTDKIEEIKKMLDAEILENWDFDKTWKSMEVIDANTNNWNTFDISDDFDNTYLSEQWIKWIENISLLNDKDKQTEKVAQYTFYSLLANRYDLNLHLFDGQLEHE